MFQLSTNPTLQQAQLTELLERSQYYLNLLTSPIDFRQGNQLDDPVVRLYRKGELCCDYQPPATRFAKIGHTNFTSLDFN